MTHVTEHSRISLQLAEGEQSVGLCCARKLWEKFHEFLGRQTISLTLFALILKNHLEMACLDWKQVINVGSLICLGWFRAKSVFGMNYLSYPL